MRTDGHECPLFFGVFFGGGRAHTELIGVDSHLPRVFVLVFVAGVTLRAIFSLEASTAAAKSAAASGGACDCVKKMLEGKRPVVSQRGEGDGELTHLRARFGRGRMARPCSCEVQTDYLALAVRGTASFPAACAPQLLAPNPSSLPAGLIAPSAPRFS